MSLDATFTALEWALRVVLASALVIHSILDITDPLHGMKSYVLNVEDSIPRWLLPAVGILRAVAAVALFSITPIVVLGALAYVSTLWCGAAYFHVARKHHPAAALPAILFVMLALGITAFRVSLLFALVGTAVCAVAALGLGRVLVTPAAETKDIEQLQEQVKTALFPSQQTGQECRESDASLEDNQVVAPNNTSASSSAEDSRQSTQAAQRAHEADTQDRHEQEDSRMGDCRCDEHS